METEFSLVRERLAVLETKMDASERELGAIIHKLDNISALVERGQGATWLAKSVAHAVTATLSSAATVWALASGLFSKH